MDLETIIQGIVSCRERIHKQNMWEDPMALSDIMTKLSVYNAYLGDNIAPLHKAATDKAYKVYMEKREAGQTVSYSEQVSRGLSIEERLLYENTQNVFKSTRDLVSVLQTRLGAIRDMMKQENINV
jgi:hypothetical protein